MKNGKCPSCGSKNVYMKPKGAQFGSGGLFVNTSMMSAPMAYDSYVCADCGLFETHVTDKKKLSEVAEKWVKVS